MEVPLIEELLTGQNLYDVELRPGSSLGKGFKFSPLFHSCFG